MLQDVENMVRQLDSMIVGPMFHLSSYNMIPLSGATLCAILSVNKALYKPPIMVLEELLHSGEANPYQE